MRHPVLVAAGVAAVPGKPILLALITACLVPPQKYQLPAPEEDRLQASMVGRVIRTEGLVRLGLTSRKRARRVGGRAVPVPPGRQPKRHAEGQRVATPRVGHVTSAPMQALARDYQTGARGRDICQGWGSTEPMCAHNSNIQQKKLLVNKPCHDSYAVSEVGREEEDCRNWRDYNVSPTCLRTVFHTRHGWEQELAALRCKGETPKPYTREGTAPPSGSVEGVAASCVSASRRPAKWLVQAPRLEKRLYLIIGCHPV